MGTGGGCCLPSDLGAECSDLGADCSDLEAGCSCPFNLEPDSSDLEADLSDLEADSSDLEADTAPLGSLMTAGLLGLGSVAVFLILNSGSNFLANALALFGITAGGEVGVTGDATSTGSTGRLDSVVIAAACCCCCCWCVDKDDGALSGLFESSSLVLAGAAMVCVVGTRAFTSTR